jgi:hypothetical protein
MKHRKLIAIALFIPRKNTAPRWVALLPQYAPDKTCGMHVIVLPLGDDIRHISFEQQSMLKGHFSLTISVR